MGTHEPAAIRCREGIVRREVGQEVLLFDPRTEALHVLNPAAAVVWEALADGCSSADLESRLRESFEVGSEDDLGADVDRILGQLFERDLVQRVTVR